MASFGNPRLNTTFQIENYFVVTPHRLNSDGTRLNEELKRSPQGKHIKNGFLLLKSTGGGKLFFKVIIKARFLK